MSYPQQDPKEIPLSKQVGYYRGPGYDEVAQGEIADLKQKIEKAGQEMKALRARTGVLFAFAFVLLGIFGIWLAAITYRVAHP